MPRSTRKLGTHCVPCEGGVPPLKVKEARALLAYTPSWFLRKNHLAREFTFKDFKHALAFVNKVGVLAEKEGHHPDISIHWNKVALNLWTHAIFGLSENDFILARKINGLKTN